MENGINGVETAVTPSGADVQAGGKDPPQGTAKATAQVAAAMSHLWERASC